MNNKALMISKVKNIYIMLLHAISKENLSIVDHCLDDEFKNRINKMIEENKKNNLKQVFRQQNISNLVILEEDNESLTIQGEIKHISYLVNRKNNKIVSGDNQTRITKNVVLKFRKNDVKTKTLYQCPTCGGGLNINSTGICPYCGQALDDDFCPYVLYSII